MSVILHVDFNSYFATVEQQANPRLRGKPIGVTGGDRMERTVLSTASVEAKKLGVKTGMQIWEAKRICPQIIIIPGDSDKYLECSKRFWNILKDYSPNVEIFSIDEVFLDFVTRGPASSIPQSMSSLVATRFGHSLGPLSLSPLVVAKEIKRRIRAEIGEWVTCSIGISYNKLMAKLASDQQKPDGLVVVADQKAAIELLDKVELDDICGIGPKIKKRLFNLGITNFTKLRQVPKELLLASFKSCPSGRAYGETLYNMARGLDSSPVKPFFEREEVKSIGHRHTTDHDLGSPQEIRQVLLKICEMVATRLRTKKLVGKTIHCWYRSAFNPSFHPRGGGTKLFQGNNMQKSLNKPTSDGLEIFQAAWQIFLQMWGREPIRMIGASISNLKPAKPINLSWLPEHQRKEVITQALDKVNNKFGDFTLQRGTLLSSPFMKRKPNPFLSDRRFKI